MKLKFTHTKITSFASRLLFYFTHLNFRHILQNLPDNHLHYAKLVIFIVLLIIKISKQKLQVVLILILVLAKVKEYNLRNFHLIMLEDSFLLFAAKVIND